jgi:hypothetical protein
MIEFTLAMVPYVSSMPIGGVSHYFDDVTLRRCCKSRTYVVFDEVTTWTPEMVALLLQRKEC